MFAYLMDLIYEQGHYQDRFVLRRIPTIESLLPDCPDQHLAGDIVLVERLGVVGLGPG